MSTGFFNTIMAGHVSEADLAGVVVGTNLLSSFFVSFLGIISGLTPTLAQFYGGNQQRKIISTVRQGFYWALGLVISFLAIRYIAVSYALRFWGLAAQVEYIVTHYLMAITLCTVLINVGLNYIFMYCVFGMPTLGGIGAGIGSGITYFINLLLHVIVVCNLKSLLNTRFFRAFRVYLGGNSFCVQ